MTAARTFVDLFAGAGGISEGFRQAGWTSLGASDVDPDACATHAVNFPEVPIIDGDIRTDAVRKRLLAVAKGADVVVGGPPCQGFSQVRSHARLIDDPKNSLYREFVRIVRAVEPRVFVMENVPGMAQMGVKEQVEADLSCKGRYTVGATVVDAADFGVPQTRKRLVFVGVHRDLALDSPPLLGTGAVRAIGLEEGSAVHRQVRAQLDDPWDAEVVRVDQALGDLIELTAAGYAADTIALVDLPEPTSAYQKAMRASAPDVIHNVAVPRINPDTVLRLNAIPPGGNHLDLPEELRARYITGNRWGQDNGSGLLSRKHFYAYRRLDPRIWSWTLNTKADSVYHWDRPRALSVREFARLQSFPDHYVVTTDPRRGPLPGRIDGGAAHSRYRQIGNAVPPLLARAIANLIEPLLGV
jgi:DNA (cytosine-5)-methyltransferase 1